MSEGLGERGNGETGGQGVRDDDQSLGAGGRHGGRGSAHDEHVEEGGQALRDDGPPELEGAHLRLRR